MPRPDQATDHCGIATLAKAAIRHPAAVIAMIVLASLAGAIPAGAQILYGQLNGAGDAPAETRLPDDAYTAGGGKFTVVAGRLSPAASLAGVPPGRYSLTAGGESEEIEIRAGHRCVAGRDALVTVLSLPGDDLAGTVLCLRPGRYEMQAPDFRGRLRDIPDAAPLVVRSADPSQRAVLTQWRSDGAANYRLEAVDFQISSPEVVPGENGFRGRRAAILIADGRNVTIDGVHVTGSLREAQAGGRETRQNLIGVIASGTNIRILKSRFERITHAITISGEHILIEGNRARYNWGDFAQPQGQGNKASCQTSRNITIRRNIMSDVWSNFRIHPDFVHFYPPAGISCGIDGILIEGNIAYLGETAFQPSWPTNLANMVPIPAPAELPDTPRQFWKLIGPGESRLPPARCPDKQAFIGVQLQPGGGPIRLLPPSGQELRIGTDTPVEHYDLIADWETWRLTCPGKGADRWELRQSIPNIQGVFSNAIPGPSGYRDVVVRYNVFWLNAVQGVSFRGGNNGAVRVERNSLLQPFPGDTDGDGRANTTADGFNEAFDTSRIFVTGQGPIVIEGNVSGSFPPVMMGVASSRLNDDGVRADDGGTTMARRFRIAPDGTFFPRTPRAAIEMARPRPGGPLAGGRAGAVGVTPVDDPYDWSWVPEE